MKLLVLTLILAYGAISFGSADATLSVEQENLYYEQAETESNNQTGEYQVAGSRYCTNVGSTFTETTQSGCRIITTTWYCAPYNNAGRYKRLRVTEKTNQACAQDFINKPKY